VSGPYYEMPPDVLAEYKGYASNLETIEVKDGAFNIKLKGEPPEGECHVCHTTGTMLLDTKDGLLCYDCTKKSLVLGSTVMRSTDTFKSYGAGSGAKS
jgi:hypothetical protein